MKRILYHTILTAGILISGACSGNSASAENSAEIKEARNAAIRDAAEAADTQKGSMEREKAVLAIRARESALRDAGFEDAADAYAACAEDELKRLDII